MLRKFSLLVGGCIAFGMLVVGVKFWDDRQTIQSVTAELQSVMRHLEERERQLDRVAE
jgi:RNase H-fold protein (predicted Holliday junction resolvase)